MLISWSYFIRKVYETDPLTCPKYQGEMRIISFIDQLQPDPFFHILGKNIAKTQFNSSLIASWRSYTEQTQAQSGSEPT